MSADWKAGDRALCVLPFDGTFIDGTPNSAPMPHLGTVYLVTDIHDYPGYFSLRLAGFPQRESYVAFKFRKLIPACDRVSVTEECSDPRYQE